MKMMTFTVSELFCVIVMTSIITLVVEHGVTGQPETRVFCGQILLGILFFAVAISIFSAFSL